MLGLFYIPITLPAGADLFLLLPVCLAVAVVYKTVRTEELRKLPLQIGFLLVYMIGGLIALGGGLWILQELSR